MKVLSGVHPHGSYEGDILFEGETCQFKDIRASEQHGIVIIHQELALVPYLSIAENIFLGNEHATRGRHQLERDPEARAPDCCAGSVSNEHPQTRVADIGVGQAAARGDRQGAVEEGEAAHPRRADGRAERRGQRQTPRPDPGVEGPGHHLDHHLAQAQRDPQGRRLGDDPARRAVHRDPRREGRGDHRGPDHQRHGRPRPRPPLPGAHPARRGGGRGAGPGDPQLDRPPPDRPAAQGRRRRVDQRAARRDRRHRGPDGRRAAPNSR